MQFECKDVELKHFNSMKFIKQLFIIKDYKNFKWKFDF